LGKIKPIMNPYFLFDRTSKATDNNRTRPFIVICQSLPKPNIGIPLLKTPITSAPIMAPVTVPIPPDAEAPPIKHAAIASSSKLIPAWGEAALSLDAKQMPATADMKAIFIKVFSTSAGIT
jgi:hypothetical protein